MNEFSDYMSDFHHYLCRYGGVNSHTRTNYISWLQFLSEKYVIDETLSIDAVNLILSKENEDRNGRDKYKNEKDITNFGSALKKFMAFIASGYSNNLDKIDSDVVEEINQNVKISQTEKSAIIMSRIGQGLYRKNLIAYWRGCSITDFKKIDLLVASHIKPWRDSDNSERVDYYNGLLLLPNYDKLFDKGYITFDSKGKVVISRCITDEEKDLLRLKGDFRLRKCENEHLKYLKFHNDNCFIG